jgi:hypothetical protein
MIFHILHYGLPLCRFSTALPCDWPEGHRWVGINKKEDATCPECQITAELRADELPAPTTRS